MAARIGIAPDLDDPGPASDGTRERARVEETYLEAVRAAGGEPVVLLPEAPEPLQGVRALLICGGAFDIPPQWYGQQPTARIDSPREGRSRFERALLARADSLRMPVLGICGGAQLMAVQRGGSLIQDIASQWPGALHHEQGSQARRAVHAVRLARDSLLASLVGRESLEVNSTHHQGIDQPGRGLRATGWAPDGLVEAIEDPTRPFWLGVQWHPEKLDDPHSARIYQGFIEAARS